MYYTHNLKFQRFQGGGSGRKEMRRSKHEVFARVKRIHTYLMMYKTSNPPAVWDGAVRGEVDHDCLGGLGWQLATEGLHMEHTVRVQL